MIEVPVQAQPAAQPVPGASATGQSLLPGSVPEPHSSGGNTVIPLPQAGGVAPPTSVGTVSQLNVTNAAPETSATAAQPGATGGSNPFTDAAASSQGNAGLNGQSQATAVLPISSDFTLPKTAADVFSAVPEGQDAGDSATMTADAASRLTAIFRPESSEEWKKAIQKAGQLQQQQQQSGQSGTLEGEAAGQTLSMKEAQAQYGQDKDSSSPASNGVAARGRSDTVQSPATASSSTMSGNEAGDDHKVWKPRRTLRA